MAEWKKLRFTETFQKRGSLIPLSSGIAFQPELIKSVVVISPLYSRSFTDDHKENMETHSVSVFKCKQWFSKTEGDGKLIREIPAETDGEEMLASMFALYFSFREVFRATLL